MTAHPHCILNFDLDCRHGDLKLRRDWGVEVHILCTSPQGDQECIPHGQVPSVLTTIVFPPSSNGIDRHVVTRSKLSPRACPLVLMERATVPCLLAKEPAPRVMRPHKICSVFLVLRLSINPRKKLF